jgi:hypothetical protein
MENIFIFIGGLFWTILSGFTVYIFTRNSDHEKRIQRIEDVQGSKIDTLTQDLKDFKHDVSQKLDALYVMVHKDKNVEDQLNKTLNLLLKELTKRHDEEDHKQTQIRA